MRRALPCHGAAGGAEPEVPVAPELTLTWQAPAGCPAPVDVEAQVARLIGGPSRLPSGKHIDATAVVRSSSPDRWSVELATSMDGAVGRRNLAGDSCASVSSAAALILALMIDPAAAERAILAPPTRTAPERPRLRRRPRRSSRRAVRPRRAPSTRRGASSEGPSSR